MQEKGSALFKFQITFIFVTFIGQPMNLILLNNLHTNIITTNAASLFSYDTLIKNFEATL